MTSSRESPSGPPVFELREATYSYSGAAVPALSRVSWTVESGRFHAIVGPNGSGKSTALGVLLGELAVESGQVLFSGRPTGEWKRRTIAQRVAFVPQSEALAFPVRVRALAEMGRYPHVGPLGRLTDEDHAAVTDGLGRAGILELADRDVRTLSGGERQRARLARALAQAPETLVLDEPTAALDLRFQMETFELLRGLAQRGLTVVAATHNLNLAARYADSVVLMDEGAVVGIGTPAETLERARVESAYRWPVQVEPYRGLGPTPGAPQIVPQGKSPPEAS